MQTETTNRYAADSNTNLLNRYRNLDRALLSCTSGDEYVRCMSRLDEMAAELQRRNIELPA